MSRATCAALLLLFAAAMAHAEPDEGGMQVADAQLTGDKLVSGMSIVGNDEAPKSLVIVPWKSSDLGETPGVSKFMDDGRGPVDRDVFLRALDYYEIRTGSLQ